MAKKEKNAGEADGKAQGNGGVPQLSILTQYVKDLSFENPNSPNSLMPREKQPEIKININVAALPLSETDFEVTLNLEAKAGEGKEMMFNAVLAYAGVFRLVNIPDESKGPAILIECPRLIFPFARQILADAIRNGGFPQLLLDPVDFARLYQQRMQQQAQAQAAAAGKPS
ncbi:MAG: protein-export chaperone SecB [Nitratireductor sp.]|nr:protein-export chaperone SecB [Nitratireductor sp.]